MVSTATASSTILPSARVSLGTLASGPTVAGCNQLGLDTLGPGDMDYDPAAVQELLAETGYAEGFKVRLNVRLGTGTLITVKNAVATDWLEMGLDVTLQNQPPAAYRVTSQARESQQYLRLERRSQLPRAS